MKYCSRESLCFNPAGQMVLLYDDEFGKDKRNSNGLRSECNFCLNKNKQKWANKNKEKIILSRKKYRENNLDKIRVRQKEWNWSNIVNILTQRVNSANFVERNRKKYEKSFPIYDKTTEVLLRRIKDANRSAKRHNDINMLNYRQLSALLIAQDYKCPITDEFLVEHPNHLSLDHIVPDSQGGKNIIENIVLTHDIYNYGKNGYDMKYTLNVMLKVGIKNEYEREIKIKEIIDKILEIHSVYPKIYEKIANMTKKEINLTIENRIKTIDLLNT